MKPTAGLSLLLLLVTACGDDGGTGPVDVLPTVDIDNGSCGDMVRFTGEYVDWDSDVSFCGVNDALFQVQGDGAMDSTSPNGRFDLCVPDQAVTVLDITPPTAASQCAQQAGMYTLPGIAVANRSVIQAGGFWSGRAFTMNRVTVDPTKAHVLVHLDGNPRAVTLAAQHGAAQANNGTTWAAGATGKDVFFPDVAVGGGTTTVSVTGNSIGAGEIPLVAGKLTNVTLILR